jgi:HK97 family phage prohead protease
VLFKTCAVEVKAGPEDDLPEGQFEAIVSVFGNTDSYGDVVMPGAFADDLTAWEASGDPIPVYWSHRMDDPDFNIGHVLEAKETDKGLWVRAQLDLDAPKAAQVFRLLRGKRVTQFSFAYDVIEGAEVKREDGTVYELRKLKVYEVGPTPIGANPETELLAVKALMRTLTVARKAGRVISASNEALLRSAHESIGGVLAALEPDDDKATARPPAKDEEPAAAKFEEPMGGATAFDASALDALVFDIDIEASV